VPLWRPPIGGGSGGGSVRMHAFDAVMQKLLQNAQIAHSVYVGEVHEKIQVF
jgi:hypothetical protein